MQAAGNIEPKDNAAWAVWFREFEVSLTTVLLLGKHKPRKAAVSLRGCIEDILRTTAAASGDTAQKRRQAAYLKHEKELINAYDKAVAAMRSDVGVDA
jgi:hypothetical protein